MIGVTLKVLVFLALCAIIEVSGKKCACYEFTKRVLFFNEVAQLEKWKQCRRLYYTEA